jgi:ABC-type sugar transport system ATPase subunit
MNFLRVRIELIDGEPRAMLGGHGISIPAWLAQSGHRDVLLGIRAENIETTPLEGKPDAIGLLSKVTVVELLGPQMLVTGDVDGQAVKVLVRADASIRPGDALLLRPEQDKLRWFDPDSGQETAPPPA